MNGFANGKVPMLEFMRRMYLISQERGFDKDPRLGKAVVGSFDGHTEGRDLMGIMLGAKGFDVILAKRDEEIESIVERCRDPEVTVLCLSIQATYSCHYMYEAAELMEDMGIRDRLVYNVGGTPVSKDMAEKAGCDVFGMTAVESANLVTGKVLERSGTSLGD